MLPWLPIWSCEQCGCFKSLFKYGFGILLRKISIDFDEDKLPHPDKKR